METYTKIILFIELLQVNRSLSVVGDVLSNLTAKKEYVSFDTSMMSIVQPPGLFDMNLSFFPFQSSADLPLQTQWSHVPGPPQLYSMQMSGPIVNLSMPL